MKFINQFQLILTTPCREFIVNSSNSLLVTDQLSQGVTDTAHAKHFTPLLEADKKRLYSYIYAFVSDKTVADDIFQETCLTLWQEFDKFELGTKFSKWANVIAFNRIRRFRYTNNKYQLGLSDDFLQEFSKTVSAIEEKHENHEKRWRHLQQCCTSLSDPLHHIYHHFYVQNMTAQDIADSTGRSIYAIRKAVHKLRKKLFDCVDEKQTKAVK